MTHTPYLSVGLFAEGRTDDEFLRGLIDRLLDENAADLLGGDFFSR